MTTLVPPSANNCWNKFQVTISAITSSGFTSTWLPVQPPSSNGSAYRIQVNGTVQYTGPYSVNTKTISGILSPSTTYNVTYSFINTGGKTTATYKTTVTTAP